MPTASKTSKKPAAPPPGPLVGDKAPAFDLPATGPGKVKSHDLAGKPYILYFYPKDDTSSCTAEACAFQDALPALAKLGVTVIGVSKDDLKRHEKFAQKYGLTFPLASDAEGDLCEKYGVWKQKSMYGRTYMGIERSTFIIDGKGVIRALWRKVSVAGHVDDVRNALAEV